MIVKYNGSVSTDAGWRPVEYTAEVKKLSAKRCEVIKITHIDGEIVSVNMSRTGAKRQQFNGQYFAHEEIGKKKNISNIKIISE